MLVEQRTRAPRTLIAVALPAALVARVQAFVGDSFAVHSVVSVAAAFPLIERMLDTCVLCAVPGERDLGEVSVFERLHALYPHVPLIALFLESVSAHRGIMLLGRVGLTDLISVGHELEAAPLQQALRRAHALGVSARIWDGCHLRLPDPFVTLLKTALRVAHAPISTQRFAAAAQMPERSLRQYCEDHVLPSPQWIVGWARLLVAGHHLEEPGRTIAQVAELLRYPSACALRNQLRRYTGVSPRSLRARGITRSLCSALEAAVARHATEGHRPVAPTPLRLVR